MSVSDDSSAESVTVAGDACLWKTRVRIVLLVALVLRIVAAFAVEQHVEAAGRSFLIEGDANGYWALAQKIASGDDYAIYTPPRYVLRVPGFPLLLSFSICACGQSVLIARLVLAIVGTGCCWLTYLLGKKLHSQATGFWAALLVSLNPLHVGNSVLILSETWFAFCMLLSLLLVVRLVRTFRSSPSAPRVSYTRRQRVAAFLTGAMVGVTVLIRPGFLPWLAVLWAAVILLKTELQFRQRIVICATITCGCLLVMLPWAARNASVTGHWVATSLWSGPSLYDGLNPDANGASNMQFFDDDNVLSRMSEYEMNQHYTKRALEFALANPIRVVELAVNKAGRFLSPVPNLARPGGWVVQGVCVVAWCLLFIPAIFALKARELDAWGLLLTLGPLLMFLVVHMVFVGSVRYRLPLEFPLSVLAAIGWQKLVLQWSR